MPQYPGFWGDGRKNPVVLWPPPRLWLLGDAPSGPQGQWRWPENGQMLQIPMKTGSNSAPALCAVFEGWEGVGERMVLAGRGWLLMSWGPTVLVWPSSALWHQKGQMLVCGSSVCGTGFYTCTHCSQVVVLISPKSTSNCSSSVYCNNFFH